MESQSAGHVAGSYAVRPGHIDFVERAVIQLARLHISVKRVAGLSNPAFQNSSLATPSSGQI